jgi:hypothetical protein
MNFQSHESYEMDPVATLKFREKFKRSLRQCVVRGFSVEESFGMIWEETLEEFGLSEKAQAELYEELIDWAKVSLLGFFPGNSQKLFTSQTASFSGRL